MDHNPYLNPWQKPEPNQEAGKGKIEVPDELVNLVHQTRATPPSDYENQLGEAREQIFGEDVAELKDIVTRLNEIGVQAPYGAAWTEDTFCSEMKRLGA